MKNLLTILILLLVGGYGCGEEDTILLHAFREAPIGGEFIRLYDSSSFEYGPTRTKEISKGNYVVKNDSLILTYSIKHHEEVPELFLFQNNHLIPIDKQVAGLEVIVNKVFKTDAIITPKTSEELFEAKYGVKIK